ncbi:MAG TPA: ABC transporter permease [Solirubrobacterales bacterium]|nr:ABC transporter permease [Solirubrobacterales bacterium]
MSGAATTADPIAVRDNRATAIQVALWGSLAIFAVLILFGAFTTDGFLTTTNVKAILSSVAFVGMIAVGTALIMISGNLFSLAVGSTAAACAMSFLALLPDGIVLAIVATIALGAVLGLIQGLLVGGIGANPIIVTIGAASLIQGVALWASSGATLVPPKGDTSYEWLNGHILTIPVPVYILFGAVILLDLLLRRSRFGRQLKLVGENREAARAAGLPTTWIITGAFVLAGVFTAIAGVELGAFNESGSLLIEGNLTYDAIAAAVVGGVAITGGRGTVWQALGGAILIAVISDILLLRDYSEGVQILVKGVIVFAVVILTRLNRMRLES